jgi:transcriptional regulator with XRE-family HTH domain
MPPTEEAKVITRRRNALGWSKRRLARAAQLSAPYIVQLENGERPLTPRAVAQIADAFRIHPLTLMTETGFIPAEHLAEAEDAATKGLADPEIAKRARDHDIGGKHMWLVADYLTLLGDDPYGLGSRPHGLVAIDWSTIAPERTAAAPEGVMYLEPLIRELEHELAIRETRPPAPIEGWDELSDADRSFVQQMVNKLRRPATGE